jgi:hypothetical protein
VSVVKGRLVQTVQPCVLGQVPSVGVAFSDPAICRGSRIAKSAQRRSTYSMIEV